MTRVWTALLAVLATASSLAAELPIPAPPQVGAKSYLLVDFSSDRRQLQAGFRFFKNKIEDRA